MTAPRTGPALAAAQAAWFAARDAHDLAEATNHPAGRKQRQAAKQAGRMTAAQYERTAQEFRSLAHVAQQHAARLDADALLTASSFQADRAARVADAFREVEAVASACCREAREMADAVRADDARDGIA